ncbi:MAG: hypothetical protein HOZ81_31170 [Streptomyces sp.]|nr:hypothetical protein [Streptomyces sp.]
MDALAGAAIVRVPGVERGAPLVVAAVRSAIALLDPHRGCSVSDVFRMWRVAFLPDVLRPDSPTPEVARAGVRAYAHALEGVLLDGPG